MYIKLLQNRMKFGVWGVGGPLYHVPARTVSVSEKPAKLQGVCMHVHAAGRMGRPHGPCMCMQQVAECALKSWNMPSQRDRCRGMLVAFRARMRAQNIAPISLSLLPISSPPSLPHHRPTGTISCRAQAKSVTM